MRACSARQVGIIAELMRNVTRLRGFLMLNKKITRKEFLKTGLLGIIAILAMPIFRIFSVRKDVSHKEARYYKNLAG